MTVKGVTIGDVFKTGKHTTATVVDFYEIKSVTTGEVMGHLCIVQGNTLSTNKYDVPFATVIKNRI